MKTYLQAQKALEAAKGNLTRAERGKDAKEIAAAAKLVSAAYEDVIAASAPDKALAKQHRAAIEAKVIHHERYEKKTIEKADSMPASSMADSSEEERGSGPPASGDPESGAPSTAASKEEERGTAKKAKGATRAEDDGEEDEEKALAACYAAADKAYRKEARARGIDAYGVRGPKALLKVVHKAQGTTEVHEAFGALEAVPRQREAAAAMEQRVGKLEATGRAGRVVAMLDGARDKVTSKAHRKELQALAMEKGTSWLKGHLAVLPKVLRTTALEADEGDEGLGRASAVRTKDHEKIIEQATANMSAAERAEFIAALDGEMGKKRTKAAVI